MERPFLLFTMLALVGVTVGLSEAAAAPPESICVPAPSCGAASVQLPAAASGIAHALVGGGDVVVIYGSQWN